MNKSFTSKQAIQLRQEIIGQCNWSESYPSLRQILQRTGNQLPLVVTFAGNANGSKSMTGNYQTIFFFARNVSKKLLLTPLQQSAEHFDRSPRHCTFVLADSFKGLFEFVINGQRSARVYSNLQHLLRFASNLQHAIVFISRDRISGSFQDSASLLWMSKDYPQGAIFRAQRIHLSSLYSSKGQPVNNDHLECLDEDGESILLKMDQAGRFSLIATSPEQKEDQPEIYVYSTQTPNIDRLIQRVSPDHGNQGEQNCIRLVRGSVPEKFLCQYFHFVRQHTLDVLVGLTQEGLMIEWNLEAQVPCRYATNLNEVLTNVEQPLQSLFDQARLYYRDQFQWHMQLLSTSDWRGFFEYWKWMGDIRRKGSERKNAPLQNCHRFHLIASTQDLSEAPRTLTSAFKKCRFPRRVNTSQLENQPAEEPRISSAQQRLLIAQISKLISPASIPKRARAIEFPLGNQLASALILPTSEKPFDDSIYDSNPRVPSALAKRS